MTLRVLVVLLLLANALLWAWSQGALRGLGLAPADVAASGPVARQVRPEALAVRPLAEVHAQPETEDDPGAVASAPEEAAPHATAQVAGPQADAAGADDAAPEAAAPAEAAEAPVPVLPLPDPDAAQAGWHELLPNEPTAAAEQDADDAAAGFAVPRVETGPPDAAPAGRPLPGAITPEAAAQASCWQAGPFNAAQAQRLRKAAAALPSGSWELQQASSQAPRWMIYLGEMEDELAALAQRAELQSRGLDVDRAGPGFEPGLSLGRYSSRDAADKALQMLSAEARVTGARVVQERVEEATFFLRAESAAEDWQERLQALPLAGRSLRRCR